MKIQIQFVAILIAFFSIGFVGCAQSPTETKELPAVCKSAPNSTDCLCAQNPSAPFCKCKKNPSKKGCTCVLYPGSRACICETNPLLEFCKGLIPACKKDPNSPECACAKDPSSLLCRCVNNPDSKACVCAKNPNTLECRCLNNPEDLNCKLETKDDFCHELCNNHVPIKDFDNEILKKFGKTDCDFDGLATYDFFVPPPNATPQRIEGKRKKVAGKVEVLGDENGFKKFSDPCINDTDGDGLVDSLEVKHNTDRMNPDSDRDGLNDGDEVRLDFDPNRPRTDGKNLDGQRWVVTACDEIGIKSDAAKYYINHDGNYQVAYPNSAIHTPLEILGGNKKDKGALFIDDDGVGMMAGLLAMPVDSVKKNNLSVRLGNANQAINHFIGNLHSVFSQNKISNEFVNAQSKTHDGFVFAPAELEINMEKKYSISNIRELVMQGFVGNSFYRVPAGSEPPISEHVGQRFTLKMSVIYREFPETSSYSNQIIITYALALTDAVDSDETLEFRLEDFVNTTNIATQVDERAQICIAFRATKPQPKANFYFVLDESGSMTDENTALKNLTDRFWDKLQRTDIDYQVGVTNISFSKRIFDDSQYAFPGTVYRWTKLGEDFKKDVNGIISAGGDYEAGLAISAIGICAMKGLFSCSRFNPNLLNGVVSQGSIFTNNRLPSIAEKQRNSLLRPDTTLIIIWVSDEPDLHFKGKSFENYKSSLDDYVSFFKEYGVGFAIVKKELWDYRYVALGTGGAYADIQDVKTFPATIDSIVDKASALSSDFILPVVPISSTATLFKTNRNSEVGTLVPRSRKNGFDYNASVNTINFAGTFKPHRPIVGQYRGDDIIVKYEYFNIKRKD